MRLAFVRSSSGAGSSVVGEPAASGAAAVTGVSLVAVASLSGMRCSTISPPFPSTVLPLVLTIALVDSVGLDMAKIWSLVVWEVTYSREQVHDLGHRD